ncbi:hypothetical protein M8C21_000904 [Ambrosia artemisiifolia]|uniref:Uncharacterized protein n=1 Tax=Ambrosia artemisiifolia TaxID=4212 RepID=A0AAD5BRX9_AMBAR|nr:hypothetical protein M8C21_000904 [Ambrosia artemisiifolia]
MLICFLEAEAGEERCGSVVIVYKSIQGLKSHHSSLYHVIDKAKNSVPGDGGKQHIRVLYKFLGYSLWITTGGVEEKTNEFIIDGMASGVAQAGADCAGARCSGGAGGWLFIVTLCW